MANEQRVESPGFDKAKNINQALDILNDAAKDSSDNLRAMIKTDYRRVREVLSDLNPSEPGKLAVLRDAAAEKLMELREGATASTKEAAVFVDRAAHKNPWAFVGGVAALTGLVGYVLGSKTTKH